MPHTPASIARRAATAFVVLLALSASCNLVSAASQPDALSVKPARQLASAPVILPINGGTLTATLSSIVNNVATLLLNIVAAVDGAGIPAGSVLTVDVSLLNADIVSVSVANGDVKVVLLGDPLLDVNLGGTRQIQVTLPSAIAPGQSITIPVILNLSILGAVVDVVLTVVGAVLALVGGLLGAVGGVLGGVIG